MALNTVEIKNLASVLLTDAINYRRYIHKNPELSYQEYSTSEYVKSQLKAIGINSIESVAGTGLLAHIKGEKGSGKSIVLRSELDALPIEERSEKEYCSINKGIMHACGHDAHTAMLLAAGKILWMNRDSFRGDIYLLFQPGEELAPGGASLIMNEGILQKINPDALIAQHVLPELESGKTGFKQGKYMASSDEIYIDIDGRGGHAALPGASTDQVLIASKLVQNLKSSVNSLVGEKQVAFGIGKFIANGATNVIPSNVHIEGTLRTFDETLRSDIHVLINRICSEAEETDVRISLEIRKGYPVLINNARLTEKAREISCRINGDSMVNDLDIRMSSEDFAFYSQEFPVVFYRLGVRDPDLPIRNLHTSQFDLHEPAMETGIRTMVAIALDMLEE